MSEKPVYERPAEPCDGFAWVGQSVLSCDDCGWPWFLHPGEKRYTGVFATTQIVVPFDERRNAQIPVLLAAWEANALWQEEPPAYRFNPATQRHEIAGPPMERQVGKDFPYATGPARPVAAKPDSGATP
jgi:hypothetical protein